MNILHISTHNENCGIGKYQEAYLNSFIPIDKNVTNVFFPHSPNKIRLMNKLELEVIYNELRNEVTKYDAVHIQHEFSFFKAHQLEAIVNIITGAGKPLISTIHTKLSLEKTTRHILSPKGIPARLKNKIRNFENISLVKPLSASNVVFVHNEFTKKSLVDVGFNPNSVRIIPIPVPEVNHVKSASFAKEINEIDKSINRQDGDVVIATVGYLNEVKGTLQAIKMMRLLPDNYKLTILGGLHPLAKNDDFLDIVSDYILNHKLENRITITGFVRDDDLLNSYVGNADIVLFPYMRIYGSSSAALNNGFANHKPIVATPVDAFKEINRDKNYIILSESFSYHDMAQAISHLSRKEIENQSALSKEYAISNSYSNLAKTVLNTYKELAKIK
jgi:glycosyltransferase involved in cell wall biosynthesis